MLNSIMLTIFYRKNEGKLARKEFLQCVLLANILECVSRTAIMRNGITACQHKRLVENLSMPDGKVISWNIKYLIVTRHANAWKRTCMGRKSERTWSLLGDRSGDGESTIAFICCNNGHCRCSAATTKTMKRVDALA